MQTSAFIVPRDDDRDAYFVMELTSEGSGGLA